MNKTIDITAFSQAFGCSAQELPERCLRLINEKDFSYTVLKGQERDAVILDVLRRIEEDTKVVAVPSRRDVWQQGWAENLEEFAASGNKLCALEPRFLQPDQPMRWNGDYISSANARFELDFITVFRHWLYHTFFATADSVYEFGCGTGFNLVLLNEAYPDKTLYGFDFVPASVELVNRVATTHALPLTAQLFDMTRPDPEVRIGQGSAIFTFVAIEQLGEKYGAFLSWLLEQEAAIYVHVEPIISLYDENLLFDALAARFHRKRGYPSGFYPLLCELEAEGKIVLHKVKRLGFGSLMTEGYTLIAWSRR